MMMRSVITALLLGTTLGLSLPAYAQVTDQTDQSEEDWRQSRKKSGTSDIYRTPNTTRTGLGLPQIDYEPPTALERLPSESRRHIMRERAKAIAESPDGDISDVAYTPSEAAQSDEQLQRDEQAAWEEVTASPDTADGVDPQGQSSSSGSSSSTSTGQSPSSSAGQRQGSASTQGPRGGSTASLQEIMDAIKSGQAGTGSSSSQSSSQTGSSEGQGSGGSGSGQGNGQGEGSGSSGGQGQSGSGSQSSEALSPLEIMRRSRDERPAEGRKRSASDYLGQGSDTSENTQTDG